MTLFHTDKHCTLYHGDCLQVLAELPADSVDAVVTDPPYGLAFMGKRWDYDVPSVEIWQQVLRVLKPGGHLLAFAGTRTQHRMACRIEDAGFEIRDLIMWVYGSGFSKGFNLKRVECCTCEGNAIACDQPTKEGQHGKPTAEHNVRSLWQSDLQTGSSDGEERNESVLTSLQQLSKGLQSSAHAGGGRKASCEDDGREQSSVARWPLHRAGEGLCDGAEARSSTSEAQRLRVGAHIDCGADARATADGHGGSAPHQSQQSRQSAGESSGVQQSCGTLDAGALHGRGACPRCGKLKAEYEGWSTNLKPACEPITMARKPLAGTVAENMLQYGTGAINVDGCRVGTEVVGWSGGAAGGNTWDATNCGLAKPGEARPVAGRWPANVIHDGSDEVVSLFPETAPAKQADRGKGIDGATFKHATDETSGIRGHNDAGGSAARFFYTAKADSSERRGSKHPTVKPLDLMRYLVRLVCPVGAVVLDPFSGSGTTIEAARAEHCRSIGIELNKEYLADTLERLAQGVLF